MKVSKQNLSITFFLSFKGHNLSVLINFTTSWPKHKLKCCQISFRTSKCYTRKYKSMAISSIIGLKKFKGHNCKVQLSNTLILKLGGYILTMYVVIIGLAPHYRKLFIHIDWLLLYQHITPRRITDNQVIFVTMMYNFIILSSFILYHFMYTTIHGQTDLK
jgi:hypothetical protein